jgi:hypothetical protein
VSISANGKLERATFTFSRAREYFDLRELQTMTGQPAERFPDVVFKELADNGFDAAEKAGVAPIISVRLLRRDRLIWVAVRDNGDGIDPDTVKKILDFNSRTSDKAAYRSPTRGLQGNASKTVIGIPRALGVRAPIYIKSCGVLHRIEASIDPAGGLRVKHDTREVPHRPGTVVVVPLPTSRCHCTLFARWVRAFSLFNPHTTIRFQDFGAACKHGNKEGSEGSETQESYRPTVTFPGKWRKFLPTDLTSPWWYDESALAKLVFGHITAAEKGGRDLTLRDFARQFSGLSSTAKAKLVCDQLPEVKRLADLVGREKDIGQLLKAMLANTRSPSPYVLGEIGEDHFRQRFGRWFGVKRWWYKKLAGEVNGVCYVVEAALAVTKREGRYFYGVNFSPTFDDPLAGTNLSVPEFSAYGVAGFLTRAHADTRRTATAFHLICPVVGTLDKGKTRLKVPEGIAEAASKALWSVVKELYREEERRQKNAAKQERADRNRELAITRGSEGWTLKRAVFQVMREAVQKSAGHLGQVSAHTLFYHVRPLIQQYTSRELDSDYFEGTLLPAYQREVEPIKEVYYEARGTLYEPHNGRVVPLGTREVENYDFPLWRYDKILFVEKKGLWPVFQAAQLAECYDMAIVAGEGYASEACRVLLAKAEKGPEYQLFVLHDADPHGYNIARTLQEETVRMPGHHIKVSDLGFRLEDALAMGLPTEVFRRKKKLPQGLQLTAIEREHFEGRRTGPKSWVCRRVELNALSGPDLIAYTERKLREAGIRGKIIPPESELIRDFESSVASQVRRQVESDFQDQIHEEVRRRMDALRQAMIEHQSRIEAAVRSGLARDPSCRWSHIVCDEALRFYSALEGDGHRQR